MRVENRRDQWKKISETAMGEQLESSEMGEVMIMEEDVKKSESGIIVISEGDTIGGVYYLDRDGNYWDEITNRRLNNQEVVGDDGTISWPPPTPHPSRP